MRKCAPPSCSKLEGTIQPVANSHEKYNLAPPLQTGVSQSFRSYTFPCIIAIISFNPHHASSGLAACQITSSQGEKSGACASSYTCSSIVTINIQTGAICSSLNWEICRYNHLSFHAKRIGSRSCYPAIKTVGAIYQRYALRSFSIFVSNVLQIISRDSKNTSRSGRETRLTNRDISTALNSGRSSATRSSWRRNSSKTKCDASRKQIDDFKKACRPVLQTVGSLKMTIFPSAHLKTWLRILIDQ